MNSSVARPHPKGASKRKSARHPLTPPPLASALPLAPTSGTAPQKTGAPAGTAPPSAPSVTPRLGRPGNFTQPWDKAHRPRTPAGPARLGSAHPGPHLHRCRRVPVDVAVREPAEETQRRERARRGRAEGARGEEAAMGAHRGGDAAPAAAMAPAPPGNFWSRRGTRAPNPKAAAAARPDGIRPCKLLPRLPGRGGAQP